MWTTQCRDGDSRRENKGGNNDGVERADRQLRQFFVNVGASVEALIDSTPFGVPTPEPWSPSTDKKKAMLSNPISIWDTVSETIDALYLVKFLGGAMEGGSAWMQASSEMLMSVREGLANAVMAEEEGKTVTIDVPVMVEPSVDAVVTSEAGCDTFVDLGTDSWGNTPRAVNPMKEAVSGAKEIKEVTMNKVLTFFDKIRLRANGIVVTSDDCSVECSLEDSLDVYSPCSSMPGSVCCDEDDFEDCPSVVTELAIDEELEDIEEDTEVMTAKVVSSEKDQVSEEEAQESKIATEDLVSDEDDYIMTEEPDSDEEDFVDVRAEFEITYHP